LAGNQARSTFHGSRLDDTEHRLVAVVERDGWT
jgi:hypothetical protein